MLSAQPTYVAPNERDEEIFQATVPDHHYLRRVKQVIDFERLRPLLAQAYSDDQGRPAIEPLLMLKLEFLEYQYNLSDREVIEQTRSNMAYRYFLGLGLHSVLPHHTSLTYFRQRLGVQRHQEVFDALVAQAREGGFVKDRLRLKDATHVIANIAIPNAIVLVARTRERLLQALLPWAAEEVGRQQQRADDIRRSTQDLSGEERLLQRVVHLREVVAWAQAVRAGSAFAAAASAQQQPLHQALALADKVLDDRDHPKRRKQLLSVHDADARRGMHGDYYNGYLVDVSVDADSQLITAMNVLPGGANEGADAQTLIRQEERAHGNDVQALSLDRAGYQGPVLHELTDPKGLNLEVFVPARDSRSQQEFKPEDFTLSEDKKTLRCPGGQTAGYRRRAWTDQGWQFYFRRSSCAPCPLRSSCLPELPQHDGRAVIKNDYEADFLAAKAKMQTPAYAQVRREHGAVERKLGELVRRHGARHARYWGLPKVLLQQLITGWVVNIKRVVRLMLAPGGGGGGTMRAIPVPTG